MLDTLQLTTEQINKLVGMTNATTLSLSRAAIHFPELIGVWSNETGAVRIQVQWWTKAHRYGRKILEKGSTSVYEWRQIGIEGTADDPWEWRPV